MPCGVNNQRNTIYINYIYNIKYKNIFEINDKN